ncbi:immunoglobulin lambda-1 light chain-like isoform X2 [Heterodontus francisci]|uniref:immunoglobulin lambda-1 light chain-like isoform X2 n=1 Tax=Heterodontus francisci TaxID=7792 RepID=UPI00355AF2E6
MLFHWLVIVLILSSNEYLAKALKQFPISITKPKTTTVKIQCVTQATETIHWYQQQPNQEPRRIIRYSNRGAELDPGISAKFSAEKSDSSFFLVIDNIELSDSAMYYCAYWITGAWIKIFGSGTRLIVSDKPPKKPSIRLFPPNAQELEDKSKAQVVCLLTGFFPEVIKVNWEIAGKKPPDEKVFTDSVVKAEDGSYSVISRLEISKLEWGDDDIYCAPEHESNPSKQLINSKLAPTCPPDDTESTDGSDSPISATVPSLSSLHVTTFTYTLLLLKSVLYCGIISFIVYKVEYRDVKKPT